MLTFSRAFRPSIFRGVKLFSSVKVHTNRLFVPRCVAGYSNGPGAKGSNGESFQDNEAEGYSLQQSNTEAKLEQLLDSPTRYQPIEKREDRSDIPRGPQRGYNLVRLPCNPSVIFRNLCNL